MSANTLTGLIPILYRNLDVVSKEAVGYAPAVSRDAEASRAALNQTLSVNVVPAATASDITPAMAVTEGSGQTIGKVNMSISKSRKVPIPWRGEETLSLAGSGPGQPNILDNQIQQAFRTLRNEIDVDLGTLIKNTASRAFGTAGTTPFSSGLSETAQAKKIMIDNGAPQSDLQMVVDSSAGALLRTNLQLTQANTAGSDTTMRTGEILDVNGFKIRESAGVQTTAIGTGTSYTSDTAGYSVGDTSITLITGSGTIVAGDVVTFAGDSNKYIVKTGLAAPGTIVIAAPGLREAIAASAVALTVGAIATQNSFFSQSGVYLLNRLPALPESGDVAVDRVVIQDPESNLVYDIALYLGYHMAQWEISTAWGFQNIKPEHTGTLLG